MTFSRRRFSTLGFAVTFGLVALLGALPVSAAAPPIPVGPIVDVANPNPDDVLIPGAYVFQGIAYDKDAREGTGVERVAVFLDDRDQGGLFLGDATLGEPNPMAAPTSQFGTAGWVITTPALPLGNHTLFFYANSSVDKQEAVVEVPITVGD